MTQANIAIRKLVCLLVLLVCMAPMVGCVGLFANFLNVVGAGLMPPAYPGLEEKKVAVVCVSNSELFGPTSTSPELRSRINRLVAANVKEVEIIPGQQIDNWVDEHGWDMIDVVALGRGVESDLVVAVDVDSFALHEGATMFKGRAVIHVVVYDTFSGQEVFSTSPPEIEFPTTAGIPATSTSEREFRKMFLDAVAGRIARNFYAFDINDDVARDVVTMSRM